jgi:hypothetical protein
VVKWRFYEQENTFYQSQDDAFFVPPKQSKDQMTVMSQIKLQSS